MRATTFTILLGGLSASANALPNMIGRANVDVRDTVSAGLNPNAKQAAALPQGVTLDQLSVAEDQWRTDTDTVSNFLSTATQLSGQELVDAAGVALAAENDELTQKAIIDKVFLTGPKPDNNVKNANNVLVKQGTFDFVVKGLTALVQSGLNAPPSQVASAIKDINADRCAKVLPAIDAYFKATGNLLGSRGVFTANRPNNCP